MTQFTCKGVKQINNRISFKHLYHSYLSAFYISAGVPNGEFPEILIAKCRSRFIWFIFLFEGGKGVCGRLMSPAHETQSMRETPVKRGRVNRYVQLVAITTKVESHSWWGVLETTLSIKVCQWLVVSQWFSPGTPVSSSNIYV